MIFFDLKKLTWAENFQLISTNSDSAAMNQPTRTVTSRFIMASPDLLKYGAIPTIDMRLSIEVEPNLYNTG